MFNVASRQRCRHAGRLPLASTRCAVTKTHVDRGVVTRREGIVAIESLQGGHNLPSCRYLEDVVFRRCQGQCRRCGGGQAERHCEQGQAEGLRRRHARHGGVLGSKYKPGAGRTGFGVPFKVERRARRRHRRRTAWQDASPPPPQMLAAHAAQR